MILTDAGRLNLLQLQSCQLNVENSINLSNIIQSPNMVKILWHLRLSEA